jgi:hypothetical protein
MDVIIATCGLPLPLEVLDHRLGLNPDVREGPASPMYTDVKQDTMVSRLARRTILEWLRMDHRNQLAQLPTMMPALLVDRVHGHILTTLGKLLARDGPVGLDRGDVGRDDELWCPEPRKHFIDERVDIRFITGDQRVMSDVEERVVRPVVPGETLQYLHLDLATDARLDARSASADEKP